MAAATLAFESADGKTLFYMRAFASLHSMPCRSAEGRSENSWSACRHLASPSVRAVSTTSLVRPAQSGRPLYLLDPATGRDRLLGTLERTNSLTVSPDGKTILYTKAVGEGSRPDDDRELPVALALGGGGAS